MQAVRREIVVELEKVQLITKRARTVMMFCQTCWRESDFVSTTDAARIFGLKDCEVRDFIERGLAHVERYSQKNFVCTTAILRHLSRVSQRVAPKLLK